MPYPHRAVYADGPVTGKTVLVHGALGAVGSLAAQLACWGGATVIGTVTRERDLDLVKAIHCPSSRPHQHTTESTPAAANACS